MKRKLEFTTKYVIGSAAMKLETWVNVNHLQFTD